MKVKTSELEGIALDWTVARCLGKNPSLFLMKRGDTVHRYSKEWEQGGLIIQRECFSLFF
jgi:hypothetical protein